VAGSGEREAQSLNWEVGRVRSKGRGPRNEEEVGILFRHCPAQVCEYSWIELAGQSRLGTGSLETMSGNWESEEQGPRAETRGQRSDVRGQMGRGNGKAAGGKR